MRVAVNVEQLLDPASGGIGRYTAKLVTLLPQLSSGDAVLPFTARHRPSEIEHAYRRFDLHKSGVPDPIRLPLPRPMLYDAWHVLGRPRLEWRAPALRNVDVVHAPSVAVPPHGPPPLVVTVHDVAPLLFSEGFTRRGLWFHARGVKAAARRADLVITGSHAAAAEIEGHTPIGRDRLRVVPYGVDGTTAAPEEIAGTLRRHGLVGTPYVLWVGILQPRKNVGTLVMAFARLVERDRLPHHLVLAGPPGWLEDEILAAAERSHLGERLHRLGEVTDSDLKALYAGADVFALPSRYEGFGLPVLEAMVQGTPVVCADIPALREVAGGAARLVPPADVEAWSAALDDLLGDETARHRMAEAGRARAGQFSWERMVRETRAVYAEMLR
jgi:glycosyltransferase involved in cell wall biosynthesis